MWQILTKLTIFQKSCQLFLAMFFCQRKFEFIETCDPAPVKTENSTPAPAPVFIQNSDSGSCSGKNRRLGRNPLWHSGSMIISDVS